MRSYDLTISGKKYLVKVVDFSNSVADLEVNGKPYSVSIGQIQRTEVKSSDAHNSKKAQPSSAAPKQQTSTRSALGTVSAAEVTAPIPGAVLEIYVKPGDQIIEGQAVLKMEAMKMENTISAHRTGTVSAVHVSTGDAVNQGQALISIE